MYEGTTNRAVSVHTQAMTEALEQLYGAEALLEELLNGGR